MKQLFITTLLALTFAITGFAKDDPGQENYYIANSFKTDFKGASNIDWTSKSEYAVANFTLNATKVQAIYNYQGELLAKSVNINLDDLPVKAKRVFAKKFENYTVKEAIRFEGMDEAAYYISAENDKEAVILKISDDSSVSAFQRCRK